MKTTARIFDIRRVLALPWAYKVFQNVVGARGARRRFVQEFARPIVGSRILDIGCGTGDIIEFLPEVSYVGFDSSPQYIASAQERFGTRAEFHVGTISDPPRLSGSFDLVMAIGVLHHVNDSDGAALFELATSLASEKGRVVTLDPVLALGQSRAARFLVRRDRGRFVRSVGDYLKLVSPEFPVVSPTVLHDLLNIPYSHLILECRSSAADLVEF